MKLKFIKWSKEEEADLKKCFNFVKSEFKASHGENQAKIRKMMFMLNHKRTLRAINRKLNKLNLTFFKIKNPKLKKLNCFDCDKVFYSNEKYFNRKKNKMVRCPNCAFKYKQGYNQRNREKVLKYYKEYYKEFKKSKN
jgi:hypothetical protein